RIVLAFHYKTNDVRHYFRAFFLMVLAAEGRKAIESHSESYQPLCVPTYGTANCRFPYHTFFFSSRRRHTRSTRDWSSDVCSSDLLWALSSGLGILFNINTGSLRQAIVPNHMLGRVISIAMVLAWSANPIGALAGGILIERTGDVRLIYAIIGGAIFVIAFIFRVPSRMGPRARC